MAKKTLAYQGHNCEYAETVCLRCDGNPLHRESYGYGCAWCSGSGKLLLRLDRTQETRQGYPSVLYGPDGAQGELYRRAMAGLLTP